MKKPKLSVAGRDAVRLDAVEKVSGKAFYTGDLELPGMAHARILRSPLPHARIRKVDAGRARALPGVIDVLTRDDLGGLDYRYGATYKDQSVVAVDKVRYVGDPVAAVLSADELAAEEALDLIDVEYEELPFVDTVDDALAPGAPLVHDAEVAKAELRGSRYGAPARFKGTNVCYHFGYARGNVEDGFARSDHVFEDVFRFSKVQHYSLEPHICIAHYDGDRLTVWSSCQDPFTLRGHLAGIFKLPLNRVRVVVPYVGGGYGGKLYVKADPIAAALSVRTRRPVKLARLLTRPANLLVLDEPTNDLDIETLEVLEEQLVDYRGTLLVVSHDRSFLDNCVTSTLVFEDAGVIRRHAGGYTDWARRGQALAVTDDPNRKAARNPPRQPRESGSRPAKLSYKLQLELDGLPARIEALEQAVAALEEETRQPDFYARPFDAVRPVLDEMETAKATLDEAVERWSELETLKQELEPRPRSVAEE